MSRSSTKREKPAVIPPLVIDPNQRYSLPESWAVLRCSESQGFKEMREGKLAVIREGQRTYVHGSELIRRAAAGAAS
jgi:hypothetical protein